MCISYFKHKLVFLIYICIQWNPRVPGEGLPGLPGLPFSPFGDGVFSFPVPLGFFFLYVLVHPLWGIGQRVAWRVL